MSNLCHVIFILCRLIYNFVLWVIFLFRKYILYFVFCIFIILYHRITCNIHIFIFCWLIYNFDLKIPKILLKNKYNLDCLPFNTIYFAFIKKVNPSIWSHAFYFVMLQLILNQYVFSINTYFDLKMSKIRILRRNIIKQQNL